jgi:ubiquitin-like 1-activating enzyme E1 A
MGEDLIADDFVIERESNVALPPQETATHTILHITSKREKERVIEMVTKHEVSRKDHSTKEERIGVLLC